METVLERVRQLKDALKDALKDTASSSDVIYIDITPFSSVLFVDDIEKMTETAVAVLYIDSIEEPNIEDHISPTEGLSEACQKWFERKTKYTPKRTYYVIGINTDLKEATFRYLANEDAKCGAFIEIRVDLDSAVNNLQITPWEEQTLMAVTPELETIVRRRPNKEAPWR